jgi:hypothetical protein
MEGNPTYQEYYCQALEPIIMRASQPNTAMLLCLTLISIQFSRGQQPTVALPMVAGAAVPLYPPLARAARVEGVVHVSITIDGHRVVSTHVDDGQRLLAAAAEENARTWLFATHTPTSFVVTYSYTLILATAQAHRNNPTVVLRLPTDVEISIPRLPPLD